MGDEHQTTATNNDVVDTRKDEELLALSVKTPSVFSQIVDRYQEAFLRKAKFLFGGSDDDAEDAVQEAFVKIYLNAARFKVQEGASFKSWGYKILLNTCFSSLKKKKRDRQFTADLDPEFYEAIADPKANAVEEGLLLDEALSVLSKLRNAFREVLLPTLIEGKTQEQVASKLGLSLGALRTRVHRAKKEFKKISLKMIS